MDDELEDDALLVQDYDSLTTVDGRVLWVPHKHSALLGEWDWYFDCASLVAYRLDDAYGYVTLVDQMISNLAVRGPRSAKTLPQMSSWQLYETYGHLSTYGEFLKLVIQIRVKLMKHMMVEMLDGHTLLGMVHVAANMEYLRWVADKEYFVSSVKGPVRVKALPSYSTLGQWASNALFMEDDVTRRMADRIRKTTVDIWRDAMTSMEEDSEASAKSCENLLLEQKLSAALMLGMAVELIWACPCPALVS